jgi:hypothetical protein
MTIQELLSQARDIWSPQKLTLSEIIPRMGKVFGDICRWERNALKDSNTHNENELKKEFGNMIFSTIRWCEELGFDPEECIKIAEKVQRESVEALKINQTSTRINKR